MASTINMKQCMYLLCPAEPAIPAKIKAGTEQLLVQVGTIGTR